MVVIVDLYNVVSWTRESPFVVELRSIEAVVGVSLVASV